MIKKFLILIFCIYTILGCHKNGTPVEHSSLIGKWKLTESYMDPGDGSGTWKPADPAHPGYIQFNADGSYTSVPPQFIDADRYKILNDSVVIFIGTTIDSMPMRYHFLPATLTIYPPCYEGCGFKYIAVNP